jgi:hypothetical protein
MAGLVRRKKMKRLVLSMIVSVMGTVAHATECSVPTFPPVVTIVQTPPAAVTIMSAGATGSTSPVIATLKPANGKAINLTGFEITGGLGGGQATLTISGLVGGSITYILPLSITSSGFQNGTLPYAINFSCPLSGIVSTNVVATLIMTISVPYSIVLHGF